MAAIKWEISPGALLLAALWYFFDTEGVFALMLPALAVHELGHALFLRLGGAKITRLSFGLFGLEMDYAGCLHGFMGFAALAAGPFFGLCFGMIAQASGVEFLRLSGSLSIALSIFNLLPVLPLDGGRLMAMAAGERGELISRVISLCLAGVGLWLWLGWGWFSLFFISVWLVWFNMKK